MYCRNCGNEVSELAVICVACGTPPKSGRRFCYNCRNASPPTATICMKCGVPLQGMPIANIESKDWLTTLLFCIFLGALGVHRFYTGHIVIGVIQLLTFGGCGIWVLIDLIMIITDSYTDANSYHLVRK